MFLWDILYMSIPAPPPVLDAREFPPGVDEDE